MRTYYLTGFLITIALGMAACGLPGTPAAEQDTPQGNIQATVEAGVQATIAAQEGTGVPAAAAPTTEATTEAATASQAAPSAAAGGTAAVPSPCPEPASGAAARSGDCEALYKQVLAKHGEDYSSCVAKPSEAASCVRPEGLESDLKPQVNIELVLDSSGSMAEDIGGITKMQAAKDVMSGFVETIPQEANVALRVYGHTGSNADADRPVSCQGSELFYPFQKFNAGTFKGAIAGFEPTGWTPIALALQGAGQDFAQYDGASNSNIIYLVSDGIETCDGDPVAAARALKESNIQATVNIIGFGVDAAAASQLRAAAEAGGGKYYEARNAQELEGVFTEQIDWQAWNEYVSCQIATANDQANTDIAGANAIANCAISKANKEANAMYTEVNGDYEQYGQCSSYLVKKIDARLDRIVAASVDDLGGAIDTSIDELNGAIDDADEEFKEKIEEPSATAP